MKISQVYSFRKVKSFAFLTFLFSLMLAVGIQAQTLKLHYDLASDVVGSTSVLDQSGNGLNGSLLSGAKISTYDGVNVIDLGTTKGYVDMGVQTGSVVAKLTNYSVMTKIFIPTSSDISGPGNFIWTFSNSNDIGANANGYVFLSARNTRYAITKTGWQNESGIQTGTNLAKGAWETVIYVQENGTGRIFIDGNLLKSGAITITPSELGATTFNYLGRSPYTADNYLTNAKLADFRIYDGALNANQIYELSGVTPVSEAKKLVEFNFKTTSDTSGVYVGQLKNGATLKTVNGKSVLDLGANNGYFDFGSSFGNVIATLDNFAISTNMYIPNAENITSAGNFIWTFANSDNMGSTANGNMFFAASSSRYAITKTIFTAESSIGLSKTLDKGKWINVTYTQVNGLGGIYINGTKLSTDAIVTVNPTALGATAYNFLGRSCYASDSYLKNAQYSKFSIYKGALSETDILSLYGELAPLNHYSDSITLKQAYDQLAIENSDSITKNLSLPASTAGGAVITWTSSNQVVISNDGTVNRPTFGQPSVSLTLTATLTYGGMTVQKIFSVTVLPQYTDQRCVELDMANLKLDGNTNNLYTSINLPVYAREGSNISWKSSDQEYMNNMGKVLKLSPAGSGKKIIVLTATVSKGKSTISKDFEVKIAEDDAKSAYLFVYFTGNNQDQEQIRYSLSNDGMNYTPLNSGNPVISSDTISLKKAVRDPHILRGIDGKTFYMVVTDMKSAEGWTSNRGIVLMKSTDMIHWKHATVNLPTKWPTLWAGVTRVWAPQTIYDPQAKKYMVYFSILTSDGKVPYDKVFYCYANQDFTDLEGEPQLLFDRGASTIDSDINFNESDGLYHFFYKNENDGGISQVTSTQLTPAVGQAPNSQWSSPSGKLQQTTQNVEGVGVFKMINSNEWIMMYDCYNNGHYQFCTSPDLMHFTFAQDNSNISARHGTSMTITAEEATRLVTAFPTTGLSNIPLGARNISIRQNNIIINQSAKKIYLPVNAETDITSFDPALYASPGTEITPSGAQNFSHGAVTYSFSLGGSTVSYQVDVQVETNPIIPDFHADPEVLYSEKTGLFYIYPTTDGYASWGGYTFDVFSSPNLVDWSNEGTILNLSTSQVSWATGNAWAPAIIEKKTGGNDYKYYFYFSGEAGGKKIGVAVADDPTGPFRDSGKPLISSLPAGASGGQQIDVDVFNDPKSGKNYIYWGNGYMAVAELNDDMVSIKDGTTKVITPSGGSTSDYQYREASYVFYRNGIYYFLWSVDDTGSPNYHVAYGTSTSPTGPINVAVNPIVLAQDPANEIYGPAHNSILQIPGRDEWYIVYHRINKNYLSNSPGTHREVCIDSLKFNADGTIQRVTPTKRGVQPVSLTNGGTAVIPVNDDQPKGNIISIELYSINGMRLDYKNRALEKGIYLLEKKYDSGAVSFKKIIINNQDSQKYLIKIKN